MADQKRTVSEIIEEMRRELREDNGEDTELFAPYMARPKKTVLKPKPKKKAKKRPKAKKKTAKKAKGKKKTAKKPKKKTKARKKPKKKTKKRKR